MKQTCVIHSMAYLLMPPPYLLLLRSFPTVLEACPVEIKMSLQTEYGRLPVLMGSLQVWSCLIVTGQLIFKYGWYCFGACCEGRPFYFKRQKDWTGIEQDKT